MLWHTFKALTAFFEILNKFSIPCVSSEAGVTCSFDLFPNLWSLWLAPADCLKACDWFDLAIEGCLLLYDWLIGFDWVCVGDCLGEGVRVGLSNLCLYWATRPAFGAEFLEYAGLDCPVTEVASLDGVVCLDDRAGIPDWLEVGTLDCDLLNSRLGLSVWLFLTGAVELLATMIGRCEPICDWLGGSLFLCWLLLLCFLSDRSALSSKSSEDPSPGSLVTNPTSLGDWGEPWLSEKWFLLN